ncbi:MAG: hypothetical protein AAB425_11855, partial [Bdellovibrionota bacterium]
RRDEAANPSAPAAVETASYDVAALKSAKSVAFSNICKAGVTFFNDKENSLEVCAGRIHLYKNANPSDTTLTGFFTTANYNHNGHGSKPCYNVPTIRAAYEKWEVAVNSYECAKLGKGPGTYNSKSQICAAAASVAAAPAPADTSALDAEIAAKEKEIEGLEASKASIFTAASKAGKNTRAVATVAGGAVGAAAGAGTAALIHKLNKSKWGKRYVSVGCDIDEQSLSGGSGGSSESEVD